jgi:menaquinone-dependent protoporphyrinogen IX oxidase
MKYLVTYWTQTGNTKKIAEAIFSALPGDKTIKPFDEVDTFEGFDLTFIGFPVMQFGPPLAARKFIAAHAADKKIALFVTHAMLTGSDDPQQKAMLEKELDKCSTACSKSELIGFFHCQGELSEKIANEIMATNIPMLMEFAGMRPLTIGHPDVDELEQARKFAVTVIALK